MVPAVSMVRLANGLLLSTATAGDPRGAALVLLPGPTDSWRSYEPVFEHLPQSIHVVAVSQRGHGDSDKPQTGYGVEDFAADVPMLLDALGLDCAVIAGHSGSCLVARRVALDHPDRVSGLVLEASPTTLRGHARLAELVHSVISNLEDPIDPSFARSFLAETSAALAAELVDELVSELLKVPARAWQEMFAGLLAYDDLDKIERITVPTMLVWGDADDLVDRDMQRRLAATIGDVELVAYRGVGHTPRWEDPARFAADVARFVDRIRS
jgi:non-heme chloroperoxidase